MRYFDLRTQYLLQAIASMMLNCFPPEILANILHQTNAPIIIPLWQCGDLLLNRKLSCGGCQTLKLYSGPYWNKDATLPKLLTDGRFDQLTHLDISCEFPLSDTAFESLSSSLQSLRLKCPNLAHVVKEVDFAKQWSALNTLVLKQFILIDKPFAEPHYFYNFLPRLPPTVTVLEMPRFADTSLTDVLRLLPRGLISFTYANMTMPINLINACDRSLKVMIELLPPHLTHLQLGIQYWSAGLKHPEFILALPPNLNALTLSYYPTTPVVLPRHLTELKLNCYDGSVGHDTWLKLPPTIKSLTLIDHHIPADKPFTPDQWRAFLPTRLVKFATRMGHLPLQWDLLSRDFCVWPVTLQSLSLQLMDDNHLKRLSVSLSNLTYLKLQMDRLNYQTHLSFKGLVTDTTTPALKTLVINLSLTNEMIGVLPSQLTTLDTSSAGFVMSYTCLDYRHLNLLRELNVSIAQIRLTTDDQKILLPASLETLMCTGDYDTSPGTLILQDEARRLFTCLPRHLRKLSIKGYPNTFDVLDPTLITLLPPELDHLVLASKTIIGIEGCLNALPRTLQAFYLYMMPQLETHVIYDHLGRLLPRSLKILYLYGCIFNPSADHLSAPPISSSLQSITMATNQSFPKSSLALYFPNAHTIDLVYKPICVGA